VNLLPSRAAGGRQVLQPVVEPLVTHERAQERVELEHLIPEPVGDPPRFGRHGPSL
jgi:hypothetical protein